VRSLELGFFGSGMLPSTAATMVEKKQDMKVVRDGRVEWDEERNGHRGGALFIRIAGISGIRSGRMRREESVIC
jgi:hypothetical protein